MKLKEVCERTGLSKKTIRLYEEKMLIAPAVEWRNGRNYREYSQEDVDTLLEIATLRKALFTMDEIYTMQQDPEEINAVLAAYTRRIRELYQHLKYLNHTLDSIEPDSITDISVLTAQMSGAARTLPLPSYDVNPKFKYLDALEQPPAVAEHIDYDTSMPSQRVLNQATLSRTRGGGLLILANYFTDFRNTMKEEPDHKAMNMPSPEPKWFVVTQRVYSIIISITLGLLVLHWIGFGEKRHWFMEWWSNYGAAVAWICAIVLLLKLALHGYWTWKTYMDWCKRINS